MEYKVVKYKNYGCTMIAPDESTDWEDKFYYSFYELNNKKVIVLNHTEYWEKDKLVDNEFQCTYAKSELKNGTVRKYEFGNASYNDANAMSKEFFDYFESNPPIKDLKILDYPTTEEENCVTEFYKKHIMDKRDEKTNTTLI